MSMARAALILVCTALVLGMAACEQAIRDAEPVSEAQSASVPDFYQGITAWSTPRGKNLEPPPEGAPGARGPIGNHPDHPHFGNITGMPTPRIGDDTNPLLTPWAADIMRQNRETVVAGTAPFDPAARCWLPGVPGIISFGVAPMYFLQTPDEVIILYERGQLARHVYLNTEHSLDLEPSWHGDSVGWYEGDSLVIDTIGLSDKTVIDVFNVPHSETLHVVETYRIVDGQLQLVITVEDEIAFTQVWSASKSFEASPEGMQEILCQEGADNFTEDQVPLPTATRLDF
jgi:hypothetical protein